MRGRARLVRAHVLSAAGEHDSARQVAEDAIDLFASCAAPYEAAETRTLLSAALEALGRHERAEAEAQTAREAFALLRVRRQAQPRGQERLSPRETDVLRFIAQGLGDAQIAERLFLSPHTVHRHVANVRTKLGVSSRAAAVAHASRQGLL
jgi:DNA-binding NarL/FixJ family response regulator